MTSEATSSGTVARATLLLRVLAEAEGDASLAQIAERMKLPASTTHRLLGLLVESGFAERGSANRTYRVGMEFLRLGGLVVSRADTTAIAEPFMRKVVEATDETCVLSLYLPADSRAMIAKVIYSSHPFRYEAVLYKISALSFGATGRGILAFLPDDKIDEVIARGDTSPITGRELANTPALRRELAHIRKQGYAFTKGQRTAGAVGLAAPVFKLNGEVVGALCMTIPEAGFVDSREKKLSRVLMEQARKYSEALGYSA